MSTFSSVVDRANRIDVTRKGGSVFGPSWGLLNRYLGWRKAGELTDDRWQEYADAYTAEMRASYRRDRDKWSQLLARDGAVLCCYCTNPQRCHRRLLAGILVKLGANDDGEVTS